MVWLFLFYLGTLSYVFFMGFFLSFLLAYLGAKEVLRVSFNTDKGLDLTYECGFEAFRVSSEGYSVQFFLIRLSFMLFDLEICLFLPAVKVGIRLKLRFLGGVLFLIVIGVVYVYELQRGVF